MGERLPLLAADDQTGSLDNSRLPKCGHWMAAESLLQTLSQGSALGIAVFCQYLQPGQRASARQALQCVYFHRGRTLSVCSVAAAPLLEVPTEG